MVPRPPESFDGRWAVEVGRTIEAVSAYSQSRSAPITSRDGRILAGTRGRRDEADRRRTPLAVRLAEEVAGTAQAAAPQRRRGLRGDVQSAVRPRPGQAEARPGLRCQLVESGQA